MIIVRKVIFWLSSFKKDILFLLNVVVDRKLAAEAGKRDLLDFLMSSD